MSKEETFTAIDIAQMEESIGEYNLENPLWKRAFKLYNVQFKERKDTLSMFCRPCYGKVLGFIKYKSLKS